MPGAWTVRHGHDLAQEIEAAIRRALPFVTVFTHVEPVEDPRSLADEALDPDPLADAQPPSVPTALKCRQRQVLDPPADVIVPDGFSLKRTEPLPLARSWRPGGSTTAHAAGERA